MNKILNHGFLSLLVINLFFVFMYTSYKVDCEQCLPGSYCEPCVCQQQYFIAYIGAFINILGLISIIMKGEIKWAFSIDIIALFTYFIFTNILSFLLYGSWQIMYVSSLGYVHNSFITSFNQWVIISINVLINIAISICVYRIIARNRTA
jgi:hypothetical protein